jgi:hypothetical protein
VALETLSVVLCTVMLIARFSTIRKLLLANFNSSKASVPDSYTTIQWALLVEQLLAWEGHFNSSSRKLWRDYSNFLLVVHPSHSIRYQEHLHWGKADSNPS